MVSVTVSFLSGIKEIWRLKKLWIVFYAVQLIVSAIMILPYFSILSKALENNLAAQDLLQKFDYMLYSTVLDQYSGAFGTAGNVGVFVLIYLFFNIFCAGGIFSIFVQQKSFRFREFLFDSASWFGRYFRLFLVTLIWYVTAILLVIILNTLFSDALENSISEVLPWRIRIVHGTLLIFLFLFINLVSDYAKIMVIADDSYYSFSTMFDAFKYVKRNFIQTASLYALYTLCILLITFIFLVWFRYAVVDSAFKVFLLFFLSQLVSFIKAGLRLSLFSGQTYFYQHNKVAMPALNRDMLEKAVNDYEKRKDSEKN